MDPLFRHLRLATTCCALLIAPSCKKAPSAGEAFITLQSGQTIPLADIEINFYGAGFSSSFAAFKASLVSESRKDLIAKLTEEISAFKEELKDLQDSSSSLEERIKDKILRDIESERRQLQESIDSSRRKLVHSDPLVNELNERLTKYIDKERSIASQIGQIQDNAHKIGVDLVDKINKAIVSEAIAIPKLAPDLAKPAQVESRSLAGMVCSYSKIPSGLRGVSDWIIQSESGYESIYGDDGFIVRRFANPINGEIDQCVAAENLNQKLNSSNIAPAIREGFETLEKLDKKISELEEESDKNEDSFDQDLQIWANAKGITIDSIEEQLSKRSDLEEEISENQGTLLTLSEDSESLRQQTLAAIQEAKEELSETIANLQEHISTCEARVSNISSSSEGVSELDYQAMGILAEKMRSFLESEKMSSTRTGSDGKFAVPPKARYVSTLVRRELQEEELFWLIKIDLDDLGVKITNSNLTGQGEVSAMETEIE